VFVAFTGDEHAFITARTQPMKLAAMEALYDGELPTGLAAIGLLNPGKKPGDHQDIFSFKVEIPGMLTLLAKRSFQGFVPGINDLVYGNAEQGIVGVGEKMVRGRQAVASLADYKEAGAAGDKAAAEAALSRFDQDQQFLGYGYLSSPEQAVPSVPLTFYAFRIMVMLGLFFILLFVVYIYLMEKNRLAEKPLVLKLGVASLFLAWVASQAGWIVSEVGRQPWAIQDLLPVNIARSNLDSGTVMLTFFLFLALFTALLIAELKIMVKQISLGPEGE
jgi:cytochrome d ubiquinol oxidase subunit I